MNILNSVARIDSATSAASRRHGQVGASIASETATGVWGSSSEWVSLVNLETPFAPAPEEDFWNNLEREECWVMS